MSNKLLEVWTLDGSVKAAVVCSNLAEKTKAAQKLGFDITLFKTVDGTDIDDDDEIVQCLNPGAIVYALNADEAIRSLATLSIIPGTPDNTFEPLQTSTPETSMTSLTSAADVHHMEDMDEEQPSTSKKVVRKRPRDVPVIVISSNNDVSIIVALKKHPQEKWVVKEGNKAVKLVWQWSRHYPPTEKKVLMAKSIIEAFPNYKSSFGEGYEHYYSSDGTGFIQNRFRQIQRQLPEQQRKYRQRYKLYATSQNTMLCLLDMLPIMGKHRTSAKNARQYFINEIKIGDSLEAYLESCHQENKRFQPYILKMVATEEASYYIICDSRALLVKPSKAANALSDLFSTFFCF
ncbi:uncharacterized protein LOC105847145 [Hydra vulgaris]|uniref:uncharacterized protein LOC105847145 n=1 Tax=Hydra vulgaris TaxID=6087 RepID=UPI001F5F667F|nr:uncharacterized protein LOC105847145 [Hydra vulgaris]XP_047140748.1 uncharacterized protein LOC105847145 [Hydra vulgaris]